MRVTWWSKRLVHTGSTMKVPYDESPTSWAFALISVAESSCLTSWMVDTFSKFRNESIRSSCCTTPTSTVQPGLCRMASWNGARPRAAPNAVVWNRIEPAPADSPITVTRCGSPQKPDVALNPLEGEALVIQTGVDDTVGLERRPRKKSKSTKLGSLWVLMRSDSREPMMSTIIEQHNNDPIRVSQVTCFDEARRVSKARFISVRESAPIDPYKDGRAPHGVYLMMGGRIEDLFGYYNVQEQTVLGSSWILYGWLCCV